MSHWNHRVFLRKYPNGEIEYSIREVHYTGDDNIIYGFSIEPESISSETLEGLKWTLQKMLESLEKPVINYNEMSVEISGEKVEDDDDIYTIEEFRKNCLIGLFIDDDGSGYYVKNGYYDRDIPARPSDFRNDYILDEYDHVVWFNK